MADFPTDLTNAVDNVTEALAKHLNNVEAKIGVDGSAVTTSLDYKINNTLIPKSLVDAKGDIITATADNTPARLPVGNNNEKLIADSSTSTGLKWVTDSGSNHSMERQAIMNGNFDVWQRGTSFVMTAAASTYGPDRWRDSTGTDGGTNPTLTRSRGTLTAGGLLGSFYFNRLLTTGAGTSLGVGSYFVTKQCIENGVRFLCGLGKKVTISFWARSSIANKKIGVNIRQVYGTGGSPSATETINGEAFALTSSWQKFTTTFDTNTIAGKTFGSNNDDFLECQIFYMWGANVASTVGTTGAQTFLSSGTIDIAQVQLCSGDVALPFCPKSFHEEYMACQRYYQTTFPYGVTVPTNSQQDYEICMPHSSTFGTVNTPYTIGYVRYRVPIRTAVTPVVYPFTTSTNTGRVSNGAGTDQAAGSGAVANTTRWGFRVYNNSGGDITDTGSIFIFHWSVNAEL